MIGMMPDMLYPTKTALIIRGDLAAWQKVNVAGFLTGGLAHRFPEMIGEAYRDADRHLYTPLVREPIFVYGADAAGMARAPAGRVAHHMFRRRYPRHVLDRQRCGQS